MRGGLTGIIIIGVLLYYTNAGTWLWSRVRELDVTCYAQLGHVSADIANPVCSSISYGIHALEEVGQGIAEQLDGLRQRYLGNTSFAELDALATNVGAQVQQFASSSDKLAYFSQLGPQQFARFKLSDFQRSVDSFAIARPNLQNPANYGAAVPWLQQGAGLSQGYGVLSQLSLGSIYAQGGGGVQANPALSQQYLTQAHQSISLLNASNTPQARQLLSTLPGSPQQMQQQIEQAIKQIQMRK